MVNWKSEFQFAKQLPDVEIPASAMIDQAFIADGLKQDSQIRHVLDLAEKCQTAVFSVGNLERPSVLYKMGVISEQS